MGLPTSYSTYLRRWKKIATIWGMLAKLKTFLLLGIDALPVEVEVDVSLSGLPKTVLVGSYCQNISQDREQNTPGESDHLGYMASLPPSLRELIACFRKHRRWILDNVSTHSHCNHSSDHCGDFDFYWREVSKLQAVAVAQNWAKEIRLQT